MRTITRMPRLHVRPLLLFAMFGASACQALSPAGRILEKVPGHQGNNWAIVDVPSGKEQVLPRTAVAVRGTGAELWSASQASAHTLVRASSDGSIDFFDSETLQFLGGFNLNGLPNTPAHRQQQRVPLA